jgi:hypothetical protein
MEGSKSVDPKAYVPTALNPERVVVLVILVYGKQKKCGFPFSTPFLLFFCVAVDQERT